MIYALYQLTIVIIFNLNRIGIIKLLMYYLGSRD